MGKHYAAYMSGSFLFSASTVRQMSPPKAIGHIQLHVGRQCGTAEGNLIARDGVVITSLDSNTTKISQDLLHHIRKPVL